MGILGKAFGKYSYDKQHWDYIELELMIFRTMVEMFNRTAPGVRFYVNCTEEDDAKLHRKLASDILKMLKTLKQMEFKTYMTVIRIYKPELQEVQKVYRESKKEA